jgi:hypothetical protein
MDSQDDEAELIVLRYLREGIEHEMTDDYFAIKNYE